MNDVNGKHETNVTTTTTAINKINAIIKFYLTKGKRNIFHFAETETNCMRISCRVVAN